MKLKEKHRFFRFLKLAYLKIFRINDTPQKIALGFGIGIFLGVLPGTGPIAAIFMAVLLRVNRASALLGSLLVNTWINIVSFVFAIRIGAAVTGADWNIIYRESYTAFKDFHILNFFRLSLPKIVLPILIGFFIISFCAGIISYFIILIIFTRFKKRREQTDYN